MHVRPYVRSSVVKLVRLTLGEMFDLQTSNLIERLVMTRTRNILTLNTQYLSDWLLEHGGKSSNLLWRFVMLCSRPLLILGSKGQGQGDLSHNCLITRERFDLQASCLAWKLIMTVDKLHLYWGHHIKGQGHYTLTQTACLILYIVCELLLPTGDHSWQHVRHASVRKQTFLLSAISPLS